MNPSSPTPADPSPPRALREGMALLDQARILAGTQFASTKIDDSPSLPPEEEVNPVVIPEKDAPPPPEQDLREVEPPIPATEPDRSPGELEIQPPLSPRVASVMESRLEEFRAMVGENQIEAAETLVRAMLEQFPGEARVHLALGELLELKGRLRQAVASFRDATSLAPQDPDPWYALGEGLLALFETGEAREAARRGQELNPLDHRFCLIIADCLMLEATSPQTDPAHMKALQDQAQVVLEEGEALAPGDAEIAFSRAELALVRKEPATAIRHLQQAREGELPLVIDRLDTHLGLALLALRGKEMEAAAAHLDNLHKVADSWTQFTFHQLMPLREHALMLENLYFDRPLTTPAVAGLLENARQMEARGIKSHHHGSRIREILEALALRLNGQAGPEPIPLIRRFLAEIKQEPASCIMFQVLKRPSLELALTLYLGDLAHNSKEPGTARTWYRRARDLFPGDPALLKRLGSPGAGR